MAYKKMTVCNEELNFRTEKYDDEDCIEYDIYIDEENVATAKKEKGFFYYEFEYDGKTKNLKHLEKSGYLDGVGRINEVLRVIGEIYITGEYEE